jgi:hypothetical protein
MPFFTAAATAGGLLFAPMAAQNALATIASVGSVRVEAEYEAITPVSWMGRHRTASASLTADVSATRYRVAVDSRAEGFIDWFVDSSVAMVSTGQVTSYGLKPLRYDSSVQDGPKHRRVLVDYTPGEVLVSVSPKYGDWGFPATTPPQKLEAVDPLTAILNLTVRTGATPANPCGASLRVFDGKQRYDLRLRYSGHIEWDSNAYKGPAIKCGVDYIEIAGFDPKSAEQKAADREDIRWANIIIAEIFGGQLTPPLQAELRSNRSGKYTIQATKLSYGRTR